MHRLIARLPLLLPLLSLALLVQVAVVERDRSALLWAGTPALLVLIAYVYAGRGQRGRS